MLPGRIVLVATVAAAVAWRPRSRSATGLAVAAALVGLALGGAPLDTVRVALGAVVPLALFLTAVIWLAGLAEHAGLAQRLARVLARAAGGRKSLLFALVCALCAVLTATISLDGAVVLMAPLVLALARRARELLRPLLLGSVAVANAFSLAVPQGNPTNLVVMARLGLPPGAFVAHLLVPALVATLVCVSAIVVVDRAALRGRFDEARASVGPLSGQEQLAACALGLAALTGASAPWLDIPPWWALCAVTVAVFAAGRALRRPVPTPRVPWRVSLQVAALLVVVHGLSGTLHLGPWRTASLAALLAVALAAAATASAANNLPASVVFASLLGSHGAPAYAALAGLSVGALATPHGSVATLIAFDRAGREAHGLSGWRYVKLCLPATALATAAAATCVWLIAGAR